jgi:hypothetical protein
VGEPAAVVDGDEAEDAPRAPLLADEPSARGIAAAGDPPQRLDVDVHELAGAGTLVADDRFPQRARPQPRAAVAAQDRVHRRGCETERPAERVRPQAQLAAGAQDRLLDGLRRSPRRAARARGAIVQTLAVPGASDPLGGGLARAADDERGGGDRRPGKDERHQALSLAVAERCISMKNHRALLVVVTPTSRNPRRAL